MCLAGGGLIDDSEGIIVCLYSTGRGGKLLFNAVDLVGGVRFIPG